MDELTGRELDKAIAERVFGIKKIFRPCDYPNKGWDSSDDWHFIRSGKSPKTHMIDAQPIPMFSVSVAAAWRVAEKMIEKGFDIRIDAASCGGVLVEFIIKRNGERHRFSAYAGQVPIPICRAALKALVEGKDNGKV